MGILDAAIADMRRIAVEVDRRNPMTNSGESGWHVSTTQMATN